MQAEIERSIREYIEPLIHLSLATSRDNQPWVCELHFAYDDDLNLYFRSLQSRRHSQEIAANPSVAGNIIKQHGPKEAPTGVYFEGMARMLELGDEQAKAFKCIDDRLHIPGATLEEAARADGHQFYKISVDNWYLFGRLDGPSRQKYRLEWNGGKQ
jgi:uncharacterized protein YhbP (UPF0306 family)